MTRLIKTKPNKRHRVISTPFKRSIFAKKEQYGRATRSRIVDLLFDRIRMNTRQSIHETFSQESYGFHTTKEYEELGTSPKIYERYTRYIMLSRLHKESNLETFDQS